jgi:hypothetical protein
VTRRITITLSDDEHQKAVYFADKEGLAVSTWAALHLAGHIEAEIDGIIPLTQVNREPLNPLE